MRRIAAPIPVGLLALCASLSLVALAGCGGQGESTAAGGKLRVVAAENFWGSIAAQLGGDRVQVQSIIVNPAVDPHSYEPTAADARAVAGAQLAVVNGIGYDEWAARLLSASPSGERAVLNVGMFLGLRDGDNPHRWYYPADVVAVARAIAADYVRLDPAAAAFFAARLRTFLVRGLARYDELRREIRARWGGTPVGYSESIFQGLGVDLGLKLLTPPSFARAVAEGSETTAGDRLTVDRQAERREIKAWVFNSQNATPDVQRVNELARAARIPVVSVTETLSPASASFEQWQDAELESLARALHAGTGR